MGEKFPIHNTTGSRHAKLPGFTALGGAITAESRAETLFWIILAEMVAAMEVPKHQPKYERTPRRNDLLIPTTAGPGQNLAKWCVMLAPASRCCFLEVRSSSLELQNAFREKLTDADKARRMNDGRAAWFSVAPGPSRVAQFKRLLS
ncbi:hypothetical protein KEM56_007709 [Ascosphaera pollenicola]|nr:hypothetical protein KEM56_007709 [Ascosphaera pollenicola]